jgi:hypothetical protein
MDDLGGLNVDTFFKLQAQSYTGGTDVNPNDTINPDRVGFDPDTHTQIVIRFTADSIAAADPPWINDPAPSLEEILDQNIADAAEIAIIAGHAGEPLHLVVADASPANPVTVTLTNQRTDGETESVDLTLVNNLTNVYEGTFNTTDSTAAGSDDDTLNVTAGDTILMSYVDPDSDGSGTEATVTATATILGTAPGDDDDTTSGGGGGGGCTIGTGSAWNITMPAILAALLGYGFIRRRRKQ